LLLAVLLKHHDLGHAALSLVEHGQSERDKHILPRSLVELFKIVNQTRKSLVKVNDKKNYKSYFVKNEMENKIYHTVIKKTIHSFK
jgi:hypothetical protein